MSTYADTSMAYDKILELMSSKNGRRAMNASTFVRMLHVYHKLSGYSTTADVSETVYGGL